MRRSLANGVRPLLGEASSAGRSALRGARNHSVVGLAHTDSKRGRLLMPRFRLGAASQVWRLNDSHHSNLPFVACPDRRRLHLETCRTLHRDTRVDKLLDDFLADVAAWKGD